MLEDSYQLTERQSPPRPIPETAAVLNNATRASLLNTLASTFRQGMQNIGIHTVARETKRQQYKTEQRLRIAVRQGIHDSIAINIAHANPATQSIKLHWNSAHVAALSNDPQLSTLQTLIDKVTQLNGVDHATAANTLLKARDISGNTPLHLASFALGVARRAGDLKKEQLLQDLIGQMKQWTPSAVSIENDRDHYPNTLATLGRRGNSDYEDILEQVRDDNNL